MSYLTLAEAAKYVSNRVSNEVQESNLLRAGVHGVLRVFAPFPFCTMYNATLTENEEFRAGLLIIPPSHLFEIESEGGATIELAFSPDGQTTYFPRKVRMLEQLRVLVTDLDATILCWTFHSTRPAPAATAETASYMPPGEVAQKSAEIQQTTPSDAMPQPGAEGITKAQVMIAFSGLMGSFDLKKALGNGNGLFGEGGARTKRGTRGGKHAALWNPVILAVGLKENYSVPMPHLKRAFGEHKFLREWRDDWDHALMLLGE